MPITFNDIPSNVRTPGAFSEFDSSRAVQGLAAVPHRILVIGPKHADGTEPELTLRQVQSPGQAEGFWGIRSQIADAIRWAKDVNPTTEMWGIAIDDAAGANATGSFVYSGTATEDGEAAVYVGGTRYAVPVSDGDAAATVGAALIAKIGEDARSPWTSAGATGTVTVNAANDGTAGNDIDLAANLQIGEKTPAGLSLTVNQMGSGATNPDVAEIISALPADTQYHTIISCFNDATNIALIEAELATRFGPMVQLEGHVFYSVADSQANLLTTGGARNSPHSTLMGVEPTFGSPTWRVAAVAGALDALENDPSRPRQTLAMGKLVPAPEAGRFSRTERNQLLNSGVATQRADSAGQVRIDRLITTYQQNAASVDDTAYLDITTLRTLATMRYQWRARMLTKYPRHKLAKNGTRFGAGVKVVTPSTITSEAFKIFREWEALGYVEDFEQFKDEIIVEINADDPNRLDVRLSPNLVNGLRVLATSFQFLL